jgi:hypothetical protein
VLPEPSPPEGLAGDQMVRWHYWQDVIGTLQTLARLVRHGQPLALASPPVVEGTLDEREGREMLAEMLDVVSDLLRDQTRGKAHPEPGGGGTAAPPRRLAGSRPPRWRWPRQTFKWTRRSSAPSPKPRPPLRARFGLQPGGLRGRCRESVWKKAKVGLRQRMRRQIEAGKQAAWLEARIKQAVEQDKEAKESP